MLSGPKNDTVRNAGPQLQLETLFFLDERGRIRSTREPRPAAGPAFILIRGRTEVVWAVHADLTEDVAAQVVGLAQEEPPLARWEQPPVHAERYRALIGGKVDGGPAYQFPECSIDSERLTCIHDEAMLQEHFTGWTVGEIDAGAGPMMGIVVDGYPVSVCFCARRSDVAAEAGVETAPAYRGCGFAPRAVSAGPSPSENRGAFRFTARVGPTRLHDELRSNWGLRCMLQRSALATERPDDHTLQRTGPVQRFP